MIRASFKFIKPILSKIGISKPLIAVYFFCSKIILDCQNFIDLRFRKTAVVLLYHRIQSISKDEHMLAVKPQNFERHIIFLKKHFDIISTKELADRLKTKTLRGSEACITFDDGYKDNITNALPILKKYNVPATIFVTTGQIGQTAHFDWDLDYLEGERAIFASLSDLSELSKEALIEIGGHTVNHIRLSDHEYDKQHVEIQGGKQALDTITQKPTESFAYPFGNVNDFDRDSIRIIKKLGFKAAFANTGRFVTNSSKLWSIPRINIRDIDIEELAVKLHKHL